MKLTCLSVVAPHYYKQSDLDNLDDKKKMPKKGQ